MTGLILIMILLNKLARFYHFSRPVLSSVTSLKSLEGILQDRLISAIKATNASTLRHYSFTDLIQQQLVLEEHPAKFISERSISLSLLSPRSPHHHMEVELRLDQDLKDLRLSAAEFGSGLGSDASSMRHFSKARGVAGIEELQEYGLNNSTMLIFNLPENISKQDVQVMLKETPTHIKFKYCSLGLPAYARVEFPDSETLQRCSSNITKGQLEFGDRLAKVKTLQDEERLKLGNRRLVIQLQEGAHIQKTLIELSRFGRVMHLDWPLEASVNPSLQEVKQFYKGSQELVKINQIHPDGRVESEYFPDLRVWKDGEDEREQDSLIDRAEHLQQAYENRTRFARQVSVRVGREHELELNNRGYCVATFSCSEECQNYYFTHGTRTKMELTGDRMDFEWDPQFRREVLRVVNNEHLHGEKGRVAEQGERRAKTIDMVGRSKNVYEQTSWEENQGRSVESYDLLNRIMEKNLFEEGLNNNSVYYIYKAFMADNDFMEWEHRLRVMRQAKTDSCALTFDELAEVELYGRILPKDSRIEQIKVEQSKFALSREQELVREHHLLTDSMEVKMRDKFYERQRERNNRIADHALGLNRFNEEEEVGEEKAEGEEEGRREHDGSNIGKHHFSTQRPAQLYRLRTAEEEVAYERRYCQFMRGLIYEYMGVFHDKSIQQAVSGRLEPLNPQSLSFTDGSPFITESELLGALQCRRDFQVAQWDYEDYVYGNEYIKSTGINLKEVFGNFKEFEGASLCHLADVGVVEQLRKIGQQGQDQGQQSPQSKANLLNSLAGFGEEYRAETLNDQHYLAKVRKLEHLIPLDRIAHLEQLVQQFDGTIESSQAKVFQRHYSEMRHTGQVADEVCDAFGIERGLSVNDLLAEMGAAFEVTKKDWEMTERLRNYSRDELKEDMGAQQNMEKYRGRKRKVRSGEFAKDPSEIYVKDREGYFKVSRYRQI